MIIIVCTASSGAAEPSPEPSCNGRSNELSVQELLQAELLPAERIASKLKVAMFATTTSRAQAVDL